MKVFAGVIVSGLLSGVIGATCVVDTTQCGGKGWTGLTKCCSSGSVCTYRNEYYSKCMPKTGPTPTPSSCSNKTDSQCGGLNFKGNTCCPTGLKCTYRNEWFSKCMVTSGPTPTPSSCSNKTDSQCGGLNFKGNTCCPTGLKCTYRNEWFSKCMTASSPTPAPTSKGTTSKPVTPTPSTSKPTTGAPTTQSPTTSSQSCTYGQEVTGCTPPLYCQVDASNPGVLDPLTGSYNSICQPLLVCPTGREACGQQFYVGDYNSGDGEYSYNTSPNTKCCASNEGCFLSGDDTQSKCIANIQCPSGETPCGAHDISVFDYPNDTCCKPGEICQWNGGQAGGGTSCVPS